MERIEDIEREYRKKTNEELTILDDNLSLQTDGHSGRLCENSVIRCEVIRRILKTRENHI